MILCCWIKKTPERQILLGHWLIWKDSRGNHRCIISYRPLPSSSKVSCPQNSLSSRICFPCVQTTQFSLAQIHVKGLGYGEKVAVHMETSNFQTAPLDFSLVHLWRGHCPVLHSTSLRKANQNLLYPCYDQWLGVHCGHIDSHYVSLHLGL